MSFKLKEDFLFLVYTIFPGLFYLGPKTQLSLQIHLSNDTTSFVV